ncbi:TIGR02594 family protein [Mucilaginibacter sabulilitoris]|uniref:TIGR02594 family protein n=1 Tax=Mucilaginibacter sabulilitoris TaxID=1173583 RepID=A0ABZ0TFL6_9SPHI|nr:TIGR02594 family protein [Mucilaginibacter sabulilitoris]WPU91783.1 TIGR02594 family protein [Mucilaginibacter sabulilitoris]
MKLPDKYAWLNNEGAPRQLVEALMHYGVLEHPGKGSNPDIAAWAKEVGVSGWYTDDDIPWCGLFVGVVMKRVGYGFNANQLLAAKEWVKWGADRSIGKAKLWDILVFQRDGGGHVGFYVGENDHAYLVYGGNQSNAVGFAWIDKGRCIGVRYPLYKIGEPANVRKIVLSETGELSTNEA